MTKDYSGECEVN